MPFIRTIALGAERASMRTRIGMLAVFFMFLGGAALAAEPAPLVHNVFGRQTTSLDGSWQTIVDPYENGYYDYRYQESPNGYFKNAKPKSKSDLKSKSEK